MQLARWPSNGNISKENAGLKVKQGIFSNPANIVAHYHHEYNNRSKTPPPMHSDQRLSRDLSGNYSMDSYSRMLSQLTTDNEGATSMLEMNLAESQIDQKSYNDSSASYRPLGDRTNLSVQKSFRTDQSYSKHSNSDANLRASADGSLTKGRRQNSYAQLSNNKNTGSQKQLGNNSKTSSTNKQGYTPKTPTTGNRRTASIENNENVDVNIFMVPNQGTSNAKKGGKNSTEKKRKVSADFVHRQDGFAEDEVERLRKENHDLAQSLKKANAELHSEKNKSGLLENELSSLTSNITEERSKYQSELLKISQQIKKLRNIQNIYVNEKKNSEKLEGQLITKEKSLTDVSAFLCDCLKSMSSILEILLVKGDYHLEKQLQQQEFSLENYLKLLYEIRRQIIPKLESAESFEFSTEWRNQDFKQVIYTTKELMKLRKSNNFKAPVERLVTPTINEKKNNYVSTQSSKSQSALQNVASAGQHHSNTTCSYSLSIAPSEVNSVYFHHENPTRSSSQCQVSKSISDLRSTRANSNPNEYMPLNSRVILTEAGTEKDDSGFPEMGNHDDDQEENYAMHKKNLSISKISENLQTEHQIPPSVASGLSHKNSLFSVTTEAFENVVIEKQSTDDRRLSFDDRKASMDFGPASNNSNISNNGKNYDLPLANFTMAPSRKESVSNLNTTNSTNNTTINTNNPSLEAVKNKILKRKSDIEARRSQAQIDSYFQIMRNEIPEASNESYSPSIKTEPLSSRRTLPKESHRSPERNPTHARERSLTTQEKRASPSPNSKSMPPSNRGLNRSASTLIQPHNKESNFPVQTSSRRSSPNGKNSANVRTPSEDNFDSAGEAPLNQWAIAKFDYDPQKENDLSFNKGEKIQILKKTKSGWWIGLCHNKIGYFPFNFVNLIE